jgi:hypothetical protein
VIDDPELGPFCAENIEAIGRYSFEVIMLAADRRWLRSARFWRPLGLTRVLSGRSGVNPAVLRPVKAAPVPHIRGFRNTCAIVISQRMTSMPPTKLRPRTALPLGGARASYYQRIVKEPPREPYIIILR